MTRDQKPQAMEIDDDGLDAISGGPTRRAESFGDAIGNYNFMVEISGVNAGYFKGVDGLNAEIKTTED